MEHKHPVYDTDKHFVINSTTKKISTECQKVSLPQHSHRSERFTFEIPKEVEGHDMSLCNVVEIHFQNIEAANKSNKNIGVYKVDDLKAEGETVFGSWLIDGEATHYVGGLIFALHFACVADDGTVEYNLPTLSYSAITIGETVWNSETIAKEHPDIIAQFEARIQALEKSGTGGGSVSGEQIAQAVSDYLTEHPIEAPDITNQVNRAEAAASVAEAAASVAEDSVTDCRSHRNSASANAAKADSAATRAEEAATRAEEAAAGMGSGGNVDLTGYVQSVNGNTPDEEGNVTIEIPDAVSIDTTLTMSGQAADAKVMGDKTNWYVTPEMYGAVGDGVADDTLPVTYALNSGKLVYFGYKRTYLITSSLRVATGYRTFIGNSATIKLADGVDDNVLTLSAGVRNLTIERLTLCGNKTNKNGLYFDGNVVGCRFYQVCFKQNGKSGIKVATVTYANQIVECEFDENGEHGFDGVVEDNTKHCVSTTDFHLCRFTKNGMSGLNINGSTNKVFGGWFEGNDVGIIFSAEHYSTGSTGLFGVDIEGNKSHGIKFMVTDGYTMDSIQIIGGQLFGSTTNVSVLHFDIPAYKNIINISIDSRLGTYGGVTIDAVNPAFVYAKQFPVEKLPSGTKLRVFVGVNDQYVTDSDIQRYIVGAKPTFVDAYKQCSYALSPGECVTVRFDTPAYCAKIKCTSDSDIQLISTVIVSGKFVHNVSPAPTVTDGVHEFSLNTDTPFIMLKNTGDTETVISNILFTGRLPVL